MLYKCKQHIAWLIAVCFLLTQTFVACPVFAQSDSSGSDSASLIDRIYGNDRYKTAVAISQNGWSSADYAVLARWDDFADALCAGPLAYKYNGPILLTEPGNLNTDTLTELKRLGVQNLLIVGGLGAISPKVEDELRAAGITSIERIYGDSRYDTSVKIAERLGGSSNSVILATGSKFPDALSVSAIAAKLEMPILLTAQNNLPESVAGFLQNNAVSQTYIVGGTGVISNAIQNQVPGPVRLAGNDRYETNIAIVKNFESYMDFNNIYVGTGEKFADALTGAVLAAKTSSPLILSGQTLPTVIADYLKAKLLLTTKAIGLGGLKAVASSVLTELLAYKEQIPVAKKYDKAGIYGSETEKTTIEGSAIISAADVTLRNIEIKGDLLIAQSVGNGDVSLSDVTVLGKTIINGGGPNSIIMYNFNGQTVIVDVPEGGNVRLVAQGNTSISNVSMESSGTLEESGLTGAGIGFVNVEIPVGAQVTLSGSFSQVSIEAGGADVSVVSGNIDTVTITETATGAELNLGSAVSVSTLNVNSQSDITGQGTITNANINTNNVTIEQTPANTTLGSGVTANIGGQQQSSSSTTSSGGGGGPTFKAVTNITNVPTTGTAGTEIDLTGATVEPADATNKTIVWSVKDAGGTGVQEDADLASGKFTPANAGTLVLTATIANGTAVGTPFTKDFTITIAVPFKTVTNITNVPTAGTAGTEIDLTGATVEPADATNKTIVWSVKDAGTTGVTTADLASGKFTPANAGTLVLTATIANGTAVGTPFTKDFTITIAAPVASTYKFRYEVPEDIIAGQKYTVPVTIEPETVGDFGYDRVLFNVNVTTPAGATLKLLAIDTSGVEHNVAQIGYWGPEDGFPIGKNYSETTDFIAIFSDAGEYSITFSLVDLNNNGTVIIEESVNVTVKPEPDTTDPTFEGVTPAEGQVELAHDKTFIWKVKASDKNLYELEVDHSMEGTLPEFSVYASEENPYGSAEAKAAFEEKGVDVTYDADGQEWTIDFGEDVTGQIVDNGGITFYLVIKDVAGNVWGSMYDVTEENTFVYSITQKAPVVSGSITRDPANTGGDDLNVIIEDDTVTFTSGEINWYPADESLGRAAGNRVGVQINAPADFDTSEVTVKIGETTYDWDEIEDGDGYFWWYPLVTEANQEFTATVVWNESSTQVFRVIIGEIVSLEVDPKEAAFEAVKTGTIITLPESVQKVTGEDITFNYGISYPDQVSEVSDKWHVDGKVELGEGQTFPAGATLSFAGATYTVLEGGVSSFWTSQATGASVRPKLNSDTSYIIPLTITGLPAGTYNITISVMAAESNTDEAFATGEVLDSDTIIITVTDPPTTPEGFFSIDDAGKISGYDPKGGLDVIIPAKIKGITVTGIKNNAFANTNITSVIIPEGVITIGAEAFIKCCLTNVTIPDSVTNIGKGAFWGLTADKITLGKGFPSYYIFSEDGKTILGHIGTPDANLDLREFEGVTEIGKNAFLSYNCLSTVILPDSIEKIGENAFQNNRITDLTLPANLAAIEKNAFNKNGLTNITVPVSVQKIGEYAFYNNALTSVTISGEGVNIGRRAFAGSNNITRITIGPNATLGDELLANNNNFRDAYLAGGAGTYIRTEDGTWAQMDVIAPTLSNVSVSNQTTTSATLKFTSDEAGTYYYLVYNSDAQAPDAATIKAQGEARAKGYGNAQASENIVEITGLTNTTFFKVYLIVEDTAGNISEVSSKQFALLQASPVPESVYLTANYSFDTVWYLIPTVGTTFRVYDSETGGTLLGSYTADTGAPLCMSFNHHSKDLNNGDIVYVSQQLSGRAESSRKPVTAGPTRILETYSAGWVDNNSNKPFKVTITYNGDLSHDSCNQNHFIIKDASDHGCTTHTHEHPFSNVLVLYFNTNGQLWPTNCVLEYKCREGVAPLLDTGGNPVKEPDTLNIFANAPSS